MATRTISDIQYWSETNAGPRQGPFTTREEAIVAAFAEHPKVKECATGYGAHVHSLISLAPQSGLSAMTPQAITLANQRALWVIRARLRNQGRKHQRMSMVESKAMARDWVSEHPELIQECGTELMNWEPKRSLHGFAVRHKVVDGPFGFRPEPCSLPPRREVSTEGLGPTATVPTPACRFRTH